MNAGHGGRFGRTIAYGRWSRPRHLQANQVGGGAGHCGQAVRVRAGPVKARQEKTGVKGLVPWWAAGPLGHGAATAAHSLPCDMPVALPLPGPRRQQCGFPRAGSEDSEAPRGRVAPELETRARQVRIVRSEAQTPK